MTTPPTLTDPPDAPSRLTAPSVFAAAADAFAAWMVVFAAEITAVIAWIETTASTVSDDAAKAEAAAAGVDASVWVSGGSYTAGDGVYSPIDFLTYRAKTTHIGVTDDPSVDGVNWTPLDKSAIVGAELKRFSTWIGQ